MRLSSVIRGLLIPILLLALWWLSARYGWIDSRTLPSPRLVAAVPFDPEVREAVVGGLLASLARMAVGAAIGVSLGLAVGLWFGLSQPAETVVAPTFHAWRQIAVFAWIPLLTAWFGNGDLMKVVFVSIATFKPVVMNTREGVRAVPREYLEVAHVLHFNRGQLLRKVILPGASPSIMTGLQLAAISAWIATIGAEYMVGLGEGIGSMIVTGREHFRMDIVLLGMVILGGVGFLINSTLKALSRRILRWNTALR